MAAVQNSAIPPSSAEYGGDEVSALILDPGYSTVRAGFAGEDIPKSVIPSYYGLVDSGASAPKMLFGESAIHAPLPGLSIKNPMADDGTVDDWDAAKNLWEYAITSRLTSYKPPKSAANGDAIKTEGDMDVDMERIQEQEKPLEEHPLLMTETGWNASKAREKGIEIAIEDWGCPAFWLARNGVLAAFATGKASALVVDAGASTLSVTPVHDGLILRKGIMRSPLAGRFVSQQIRQLFARSQPPVPLVPHFLVSSKTPVDAGAPANAVYRTFDVPPHESFRQFEEERVLTEFKESVVQIWNGQGRLSASVSGIPNEEIVRSLSGRPFEMPDGWNQVFGAERFTVAEGIFDAKMALSDSEQPPPSADQTLPALIQSSLNAVDVDIRSHLLGNVVVTGGTSLLQGFVDRLNMELIQMYPGPRLRLTASASTAERKFASWIGGSILGSLGTFHQMWISKKEYEEHGANIVDKRCK